MEDLVNMIISDANASDISNKIKEVLYAKAAENLDTLKPHVASSMFGDDSN
jgi:hypothetical protein